MADNDAALRPRIDARAAGLVAGGLPPYLSRMGFFGRFSPLRAYRDLRFFLAQRQPYELGFLVIAMVVTGVLIVAFAQDSYVEPTYKRDITYVEQWPADRTDAQIRAQQAIDAPIKAARIAADKAADEKRRESFRRAENMMSAWGL